MSIALFGLERFGVEQTESYGDKFREKLEELAQFPDRYPSVDYIRYGVRRAICGVHSIYYRKESDRVLILRVLGRQDLNQAFDE
ncbi:MAG: type II toxin-antitoxin system RelE/ParE family toxin [Candidatus Eremiobacteraeota bacterium]|nr:type II toxin-antitoxin system RelE/ParE family toxin [Candidatus Eremiobacteraeota bacterium]